MKPYIFVLICFMLNDVFAQNPIVTTSIVTSATVYFSGVELSHTSQAMIPPGTSECIIKNISNHIFESSIQITIPKNISILSSRYHFNSNQDEASFTSEMLVLKDSIFFVNKELRLIDQSNKADRKTLEILDQNTNVTGSESGLNTTELIKLIEFNKTKRMEIETNLIANEEKSKYLNIRLIKLEKKLYDIKDQKVVIAQGEIVLQIHNKGGQSTSTIDIKYLSPNATWSPLYDIKAQNITEPIDLVYKANISQNSGLDWKNIKLSLSSGIPNQNNETPILKAWHLNYVQQLFNNYQKFYQQNTIPSVAKMKSPFSDKTEDQEDDLTSINDNQLAIGFDFDTPYDILSNGKVHTLTMREIKIPATFKYYAVPKLEKDVYLLAEVGDYAMYHLLPGEANIIFDNVYAGKTFLNPYQANDTLNINMGRDNRVTVKKEKIADQSSTKFLSSNKIQVLTYDITVKNNKTEKINLTLKDQIPLSDHADITVELLESTHASLNSETGILTWISEIEPNQSRKYRVSYKVKYPKDKIVNL